MNYQILGSWVNDRGRPSRAPRRRKEILSLPDAEQLAAYLTEMYGQCCRYQVVTVEE
jgi:hypothetical protein